MQLGEAVEVPLPERMEVEKTTLSHSTMQGPLCLGKATWGGFLLQSHMTKAAKYNCELRSEPTEQNAASHKNSLCASVN